MREKTLWAILIILLLTCLIAGGMGPRKASSGGLPVVSLEPPTITSPVNETFAVNITVIGITEQESLYGWGCRITFNSSIINAVNATEGPFLENTGYDITWLTPNIDNTNGRIDLGALITPSIEWGGFPPTGATGNGTLATVVFQAKTGETASLHFEYTELYTIVANKPVPIDHVTQPPIAKMSSIISITASSESIALGKNTTINGSITPKHIGVTVTIHYRPAAGIWTALIKVTTDMNGQYLYVWTPTTVGTYELKASWLGDANTESAESDVITVKVVEIQHITLDIGGATFHVFTESNSTVSNFQLIPENKEIRFDVTGPSDTFGFCNVTIPINLLGGPYTVRVDGYHITPEETTNGTHSFLYFMYNHSTHRVEINGVTVATPPIALFNLSTTSAYVGDPITFDASASGDPDGDITSYRWDFGDGNTTTVTIPITAYEYTSLGTYLVTLTVTDNQSLADIATDTVTVSAKHDVAVVNVTPSPKKVTVGERVSINVTVVNHGTETETFNITVYYDNTIIGAKPVTNLDSGSSETFTINWETTNVDPDTYTIKAVASTLTGEIDTANNELVDETVTITVQETPASDIPLYVIAAGVATVITAALAFYFLRIRKPKST